MTAARVGGWPRTGSSNGGGGGVASPMAVVARDRRVVGRGLRLLEIVVVAIAAVAAALQER